MWQCQDVEAHVASLSATRQDGMERASLQLSACMPAHTALGSPLTRKFPSQQGSYLHFNKLLLKVIHFTLEKSNFPASVLPVLCFEETFLTCNFNSVLAKI